MLEHHLHHNLIHTYRSREGVTSCKGDAYCFQEALEHTILAICTVQCGYSHIEGCHYGRPEKFLLAAIEVVVAILGAHIHLLTSGFKAIHVAEVRHCHECLAGVPATLLRDVNGYYIVLGTIKSVHCLEGCQHRDFMLDRATSEKYSYGCFHYSLIY